MNKILLIMIAFLVIGCAGVGFSWQDASTVRLGDTGAEVIDKMQAKPYMIKASTVDGKIVETYIWSFTNGMTGSSQVVSFVLTDGKVTSVPTITESIKNQ
ncbi:MAG: hypothetical protein PHV62_09345 [Sulfuricurvum sp.]|nr:hypothetical protein [Sulfuricurvum sp.]